MPVLLIIILVVFMLLLVGGFIISYRKKQKFKKTQEYLSKPSRQWEKLMQKKDVSSQITSEEFNTEQLKKAE